MHIDHVGLWVKDLEAMKDFYSHYFDLLAGEKYRNESKQFSSYFLSAEHGCRLELMHSPQILGTTGFNEKQTLGFAHFAISMGSVEKVKALSQKLCEDGFQVIDGPRMTGDGYFEACILDPENNRIEITV